MKVKAVYTNKAPGGVAYRCSFRITEAVYLVERMVNALALEMGVDQIDLRMRSFIAPEQFPYETTTGWTYDSGNYAETMKVAMDIAGYDDLLREQAEKRERGELMGIGVSFFTEGVGAGPRKHMDILGMSMNDGADLRVHPSGKAVVSISAQTQGQGHETTFAQIVAEELGIPPEDVEVRHGDTDRTPYGLGTYGSRSTPVSGAAVAVVSRKVRDKARLIAATMLETRPEDLAWEKGRWYVKGDPEKGAMIEDIASRAYSGEPMPEGMEGGLDAQVIYDPPNLTYPYGAYIAVVDIDPDTAQVTVRRFIAVDDCGVRINPMVVDGQIHGGLAEGIGIALMEVITFDEEGNCLNSSFMDYLIPTALECPDFELGETVTPCPAPPAGSQGRRRVAKRRLAAGDRQRGDRRPASDPRRRPHRHALQPGPGVGGDAGPPGAAAMIEVTGEPAGEIAHLAPDVETLARRLAAVDYLVDEGLATAMFLSLRLPQPLLLEGEAGVGKTEAGKSLAAVLDTPLVRLQCYEGIDAAEALYEWNYPRQLLSIRLAEARGDELVEEDLFGPDYLTARPLLRALQHPGPRPAVLLIDEIDRADDDFEAFLLELLGEAAVTIPEIGTVRATHPPVIVLTSNRTRDLHDAVKRRCLYQWIDYPSPEREVEIIRRRVKAPRRRWPCRSPTPSRACATPTCRSRRGSPRRSTGWPRSTCSALPSSTSAAIGRTLGSVLKYREDQEVVRGRRPGEADERGGLSCRRARPGCRRWSSICRRWSAPSAAGCTRPGVPVSAERAARFAEALSLVRPRRAPASVLDRAGGVRLRSHAGQGL